MGTSVISARCTQSRLPLCNPIYPRHHTVKWRSSSDFATWPRPPSRLTLWTTATSAMNKASASSSSSRAPRIVDEGSDARGEHADEATAPWS